MVDQNSYLLVRWIHDFQNEPTLLYSEVDSERMEIRKVEVFEGGSMSYADKYTKGEITLLGETPLPSIQEIAKDSQFKPSAITAEEFEMVWQKAIQQNQAKLP